MRPRSLLQSFQPIFRRYASRLPERPPYRPSDPLVNNPHASYQPLSDDMTFVHRPPPTAPSPFSYTVSPTSPLLKPANPENNVLPPTVRKEKTVPRMSDEDLERMRKLRAEDPRKWTTGRLAKEFNCTPRFVMMQARLPVAIKKELKRKRDAEHQEAREKWGEKKAFNHDVRQRRREFW
ncbi:hypothetical protein K474DRAFT_1249747 [Panus rudis PR-1116 ss-1]|nr:hypothetical protein K474DRAFT_1249747 [Panus rudis PR-1116 ss-1]